MRTIEQEMRRKKNQPPTSSSHETAGEELISICMGAAEGLRTFAFLLWCLKSSKKLIKHGGKRGPDT